MSAIGPLGGNRWVDQTPSSMGPTGLSRISPHVREDCKKIIDEIIDVDNGLITKLLNTPLSDKVGSKNVFDQMQKKLNDLEATINKDRDLLIKLGASLESAKGYFTDATKNIDNPLRNAYTIRIVPQLEMMLRRLERLP